MRVRDLGPLTIAVDDRELPVRGIRLQSLLGRLAVDAGRWVSSDALVHAVWGDHRTPGRASTLESHVWRLRGLLEPGRRTGEPSTVLVTGVGGYRLAVGPLGTDSLVVGQEASEVPHLLAAGRPEAALEHADRALALWRGQVLGPLADRDWARPAVAHLGELHGQLRGRRVDALLAVGRYDVALADLESLLATAPLHEASWRRHMLALHHAGRTEEALAAYRRLRRLLADELGTEPGAEVRDLHQQLLRGEVAPPRPRPELMTSRRAPEVSLPAVMTALVGRSTEVAHLVGLLRTDRLVTVTGAAGCGKTRLTIEVAGTVAPQFPDGVWFVDLTATTDPDLVADVVVSTIGFTATAGATSAEQLRDYLRPRRALVVLDNCEHVLPAVARIVEVVLGRGREPAACTIAATSREPIAVDGETIFALSPLALPDDGDDVATAPSVTLFLQRLRAVAPALPVDADVLAQAAAVCRAVDGVPLAIELAAARVRTETLAEIVEQVTTDPAALRRIGRPRADHRDTVHSTIEWSHRLLAAPERLAHRRLSVLPGAFTRRVATTVVGAVDADRSVDGLVHRSMLVAATSGRPGGPTSYRQLSTIRAHAHRALDAAGERRASTARRDAWTADLVGRRPATWSPASADWYRAVDDDYPTVRATLADHLLGRPDPTGAHLAPRLTFYWYYRNKTVEANRWLRLACAGAGGIDDAALAHSGLAAVLATQGRADLARPHTDVVIPLLARVTPAGLPAVGEHLVGLASGLWVRYEFAALRDLLPHLDAVVDGAADPHLALVAEAVHCLADFATGDAPAAVAHAEDVYHRATQGRNALAAWLAAGVPMVAALDRGDPETGARWVHRVLDGHLRFGDGAGGVFVETYANLTSGAGDLARSVELHACAYRLTRRAAMTWPRHPRTHAALAAARTRLGEQVYQRNWQQGERLTLADVAAGAAARAAPLEPAPSPAEPAEPRH